MTTPGNQVVREPAADQMDYRARAYDAAMNLAELTRSFDPRLKVTCDIGPKGEISVFLLDDAATLTDAQQLAVRLGLEAHDTQGTRHIWQGYRCGLRVTVRFIDDRPTCLCGKPLHPEPPL